MEKLHWTVDKPPRVHELAKIMGMFSVNMRRDLEEYALRTYGSPVRIKSASSRVPLRLVLDYVNYRYQVRHR